MFKGHGDIYDPYCKPKTFKNYHPYSSNNSGRAQPYIFGVIYSGVAVPAWEAGRSSGVAKESNACKNLSENLSLDQGTMEEVFTDFKGFRAGLIKALTTDVEQINLPAEEVHPELLEPALGTNFARDGMQERDWLSLVAVHSDAWLLSVAFYFSARFDFDKIESAETKIERDVRWKSEKKKKKQVCR
ncbi:hypothetical protein ACFX2J_003400 [Malus domestica]